MANRIRRECVLRTNDELTLIQYTGRPEQRRMIPESIKVLYLLFDKLLRNLGETKRWPNVSHRGD